MGSWVHACRDRVPTFCPHGLEEVQVPEEQRVGWEGRSKGYPKGEMLETVM